MSIRKRNVFTKHLVIFIYNKTKMLYCKDNSIGVNMNKLYEKIMNGANVSKKAMSELCDWLDSNINDGYLTEDDAKVEKYEKMKKDLNEYVGYLWR